MTTRRNFLSVAAIHLATCFMTASGEWKVEPATEWSPEVRVWDPAPEMKLTFEWDGGTNAKHEAEGEGALTWFLPGDGNEMLSRYQGGMVAGKREGHGVWVHKSGSRYEGGWKNNVKEGFGEYSLGDGNYYKGEFRNDRMHGKGLWVGADGITYEGAFVDGKRDGAARLTLADGTTRDSNWKDGEEIDPPAAPENARPALMVAMDRSKYSADGEVARENEFGYDMIEYKGGYEDGSLVIEPDWDIWNDWKKGGPIGSLDIVGMEFDISVFPAFLEIRLFNPGKTPLSIVSAEVEGLESHPDLEPLLAIGDEEPDIGGVTCGIRNFKDTKVDSCEISYKIQPVTETPVYADYRFKASPPPFKEGTSFSIAEAVATMGIDVAGLEKSVKELESIDPDMEWDEQEKLKAKLKDQVLKSLGEHAKTALTEGGNVHLAVNVVGEMKAGWADHEGKAQSHTVKFHFKKVLFNLYLERGAAGPSTGRFDIMLPVSGKNYSKPFPYRKTIRAGGEDRFALRVASEGSSKHEFRVRLTTADGDTIISKPCRLTYLLPDGFSWNAP